VTAPNVEFVGTDAAMADLKRWADDLKPQVDKAGAPLGQRVAGTVRGRVPHLSGQLAGSVESSTDEEGIVVSLGDGVPYAGWIEFGGSRGRDYVPEGRYLYPSMLDAQDEYEQLANNTAADSIGRFRWSTPSAAA
jgi:phage gpG-like protein